MSLRGGGGEIFLSKDDDQVFATKGWSIGNHFVSSSLSLMRGSIYQALGRLKLIKKSRTKASEKDLTLGFQVLFNW